MCPNCLRELGADPLGCPCGARRLAPGERGSAEMTTCNGAMTRTENGKIRIVRCPTAVLRANPYCDPCAEKQIAFRESEDAKREAQQTESGKRRRLSSVEDQ